MNKVNALIICGNAKNAAILIDTAESEGFRAESTDTLKEAVELCRCNRFGVVIIDSPLIDGYGEKPAERLSQITSVVMLVRAPEYETACQRLSGTGVIVIKKPINKTVVWSALKMCKAAKNGTSKEAALIIRAKTLLMACIGMSEQQAHKYIERQAMDRRIKKSAVAADIIKTYDT